MGRGVSGTVSGVLGTPFGHCPGVVRAGGKRGVPVGHDGGGIAAGREFDLRSKLFREAVGPSHGRQSSVYG
jgi:hypothetical protein